MKKLLVFSMLLVSFVSYGQDRINKKPTTITIKKQLTQSIGWMLDKSGEWKSRPNRIPKADVDKILIDYEFDGLGEDNFISYQVGEIKVDDSVYVILIKKSKDGFYKYESIQRGWTPCLSASYYIFTKNEFEKLKNIKDDEINIIDVKSVLFEDINYVITNDNLLYQIKKDILEKKLEYGFSDYSNGNLRIIIHPITKQNKTRFMFETLSRYSDNNVDETKKTFKNSYYEVSSTLFTILK
jgi:hypothetical protein